jgi:acetolactate synthase-1/2/3 large subunit
MPTVGELIVETLAAHYIDRIFCVPGESYLGLLDALYGRGDVDTVVCRHESGAGFMALADARLSGRPGVACVSRGPGACNAAIAVHTAQQDGVPFILLIGQVAARDVRRESFQEIDYSRMFGSIAKWTAEITDAERAAETMLRALQTATTGVPGAVVVAVPEDVLTAECAAEVVMPQAPITSAPSAASLAELRHLLAHANRPLAISGSGIDKPGEREKLLAFLEAWELPSVVSFRCQDLLPNNHRLYAGDMGLSNPASQMRVLKEADLLVVLGARLTDITTQGYAFPSLVRPAQQLVHIHGDPTVIGSHFASDLSIACSPVALIDTIGQPDGVLPDRRHWIARLVAERREIAAVRAFDVDDGVPFELVVELVGRHLSEDAIVTLDAGAFAAPAYRVIDFKPPQRLIAPISGAMGFGVPAAVAASLRQPGREVICFVGDGGLLMTGSELAVAMERKLPLKIIVSENRLYGSIRIHQERDYPGRSVGTSLVNPDLTLVGSAYGCSVTRISNASQLAHLPDVLQAPGPQFIVVDTSVKAMLSKPATVRDA